MKKFQIVKEETINDQVQVENIVAIKIGYFFHLLKIRENEFGFPYKTEDLLAKMECLKAVPTIFFVAEVGKRVYEVTVFSVQGNSLLLCPFKISKPVLLHDGSKPVGIYQFGKMNHDGRLPLVTEISSWVLQNFDRGN